MKAWIKAFFAVDNDVNEHTVMGVLFFVASLLAGFVFVVPQAIFFSYLGASLTCFGLSYKRSDFDGLV